MDDIGLKDVLYDLLLRFIEYYDAKRGIPRPVSDPYITARQAAFRCLTAAIRFLWFLTCGIGCACLLVFWARSEIEFDTRIIFLCGATVAGMVGVAKAMQSFLPYEREDPPVPKPPSAWAETPWLKSTGLAQEFTGKRGRGELRLGTLPTGYQLVLPSTQSMRHVALFGPEGSGKSSTFICTFLRDWAKRGSTIVLDPKGELFEQTASHYRQVYRLDLIDPTRSDYWNFVPDCKGNARLASEIAALIIDSNSSCGQSDAQKAWREIEMGALTAILLHLPHIVDQPTPAMIGEFISSRSLDPIQGDTESPLTKEMNGSPDLQVGTYWRRFSEARRDLQGRILIDLISKCQIFSLSVIKADTSTLATVGSAPRAEIDLETLRNPGTAIYVTILEAEVDRYLDFLTLFLRLALSVLSILPPTGIEDAPCLFVFDDASDIQIPDLFDMLNSALDSEVAIVLAYRHVDEIYQHYGRDSAHAILNSIKTLVFLPGLNAADVATAAGFARWHTATHWAVRRQGKQSRAERLAEADLFSTYEQAFRKLSRHQRAIALVGTAPPTRFMFPPFAWLSPEDRSRPANKGTPYAIDFQTAEAQTTAISI
jgi:type IV secretory pathway TraG/TraD family ATPase VirD4